MRSRSSSPRLTRRELSALLGASPLLAIERTGRGPEGAPPVVRDSQVTQKIPPQGAPAPAPPNATPAQKIEKALADVHELSGRLAQLEVPRDIEPAFAFRP